MSSPALLGAFVGDATALGAHWIYERAEIAKKFSDAAGLHAPATTYHPGKKAGDFTHLGDQMWILLMSMQAKDNRFEPADFMRRWTAFWKTPGNPSYPDKATRQTLAAIDGGASPLDAGTDSEELAGPARGMVALALGIGQNLTLDELVGMSKTQTRLTHRSALADDTALFLARLMFSLGRGRELSAALDESLAGTGARTQALAKKATATEVSSLSTGDAIEALGQSCSLSAALPATVLLLHRHGHSFAEAIRENVNAGGDSAARGIVIGGVLGLVHGTDAIPAAWRTGLCRMPV